MKEGRSPSESNFLRRDIPVAYLHDIPREKEPKNQPTERQRPKRRDVLRGILGQAAAMETTVLLGRIREDRDGPMKVVIGGDTLVGDEADGDDLVVNFPPGAKGKSVQPEKLDDSLNAFPYWRKIDPSFFPKSKDRQEDPTDLDLEGAFLKAFKGPFAWIVRARPLTKDQIEAQAEGVRRNFRDKKPASTGAIDLEVSVESLRRQYEELTTAREGGGFWNVDILVGAKTEKDIKNVASGLGAAADALGHPYNFKTGDVFINENASVERTADQKSLQDFLGRGTSDSKVSTSVLTSLAAIPKVSINGVSLSSRPEYGANIPKVDSLPPSEVIKYGKIYDGGDLAVPVNTLTAMELVTGATRSGKSDFTRKELTSLAEKGIPWLVLDPKGEDYSVMGDRLKDLESVDPKDRKVILYQIGDLLSTPSGFNLLEPEPGFSLEQHISKMIPIILNAFGAEPGKDDTESSEVTGRYLKAAIYGRKEAGIKGLYEKFGIDIVTGQNMNPDKKMKRYPNMLDLMVATYEVAKAQQYEGEGRNIVNFLRQRIESLSIGVPGEFFMGEPMSMKKIMGSNVVVDLSRIDNPVERSLIMSTFLLRQHEYQQNKLRGEEEGGQKPLHHFTVVEEANEIVGKGPMADQMVQIMRTAGAGGIGIRIVAQNPDQIHPGALGNTNNKFALRTLQDVDQKAALGTVLTEEQRHHMGTFDKGEIVAHIAGMQEAVFGRTDDPRDLPSRKDRVASSDELIETSDREEVRYTRLEINEARKILESPAGKILQGWAELLVVSKLIGFGDIKPNFDYAEFDSLQEMDFPSTEDIFEEKSNELSAQKKKEILLSRLSQEDIDSFGEDEVPEVLTEVMMSRVRDYAINKAAEQAVTSRLKYVKDVRKLTDTVSDRIATTLDGEEPTEWVDPDLMLPSRRFFPLKFAISERLKQAEEKFSAPLPGHPQSEAWVEELPLLNIPVSDNDEDVPDDFSFASLRAVDQRTFLRKRMDALIDDINEKRNFLQEQDQNENNVIFRQGLEELKEIHGQLGVVSNLAKAVDGYIGKEIADDMAKVPGLSEAELEHWGGIYEGLNIPKGTMQRQDKFVDAAIRQVLDPSLDIEDIMLATNWNGDPNIKPLAAISDELEPEAWEKNIRALLECFKLDRYTFGMLMKEYRGALTE